MGGSSSASMAGVRREQNLETVAGLSNLQPLLNPLAEEWRPVSEDDRSLYVTFSKGNPLTKAQLFWGFTMRYGFCLEKVVVKGKGEEPPVHGKLVLTTATNRDAILNGKEKLRMEIFGKTIVCKRFIPRNQKKAVK